MATFTDFTNKFTVHPVNGTLKVLNDADSVKQSIRNLILTDRGERFFQPSVGCKIRTLLFDNFTPQSKIVAKQTIEETIELHEPRAMLQNVDVSAMPDNNAVIVSVLFNLINSPEVQSLDLEIERIR